MGPTDDDIQFDFFEDEPATTEVQQPARGRLPRRGATGSGGGRRLRPPAGPPRNLTPMLRLAGLVVGLVVVLVVFGLLLQSCTATSKHARYEHYLAKVATIAKSSADDGTEAANALIAPGAKAADLSTKLLNIAQQEQQNVVEAQKLSPPGQLREQNSHIIEALQLRVSGTEGLAKTFTATSGSTKSSSAQALAEQAERLVASDVIWDDLVYQPTVDELRRQGIVGISPPKSRYVANTELVSETSMASLLARIGSSGSSGPPSGLHGTNIVETKALPAGTVLSETAQTTVNQVSPRLAFAVSVKDSGNFQEAGIKVTLTIQQKNPLTKTETIKLINPGQTKTVTFRNLGEPTLVTPAKVAVDVKAVPGETKVDNNRATYPVLFSLVG